MLQGKNSITLGWNWNWTRSPGAAFTLFGRKDNDPFGPPTWTMCVLTMPDDELSPVERLPDADCAPDAAKTTGEGDCAAANPMRALTMMDFEKYIFAIVVFTWCCLFGIMYGNISSREWIGD